MQINKFEDLTKFDKQNAKSFLELSFAVSDWSVNVHDDDTLLPKIPDFELKKTFKCYDTYGFTYRKFGVIYYSEKLNMALVSFSSTQFVSEWIDDFDFRAAHPSNITTDDKFFVHIQHYNLYNSLRDELIKSLKSIINDETVVVVTGHSLGGSVSSICFFDFVINNVVKKRTLYTFGSPRPGNTAFAEVLNNEKTAMRVANTADLATTVPPPIIENFIYTHHNGIYFTMNLDSYSLNHIESYTKFFN